MRIIPCCAGLNEAVQHHNNSAKLSLHFRADENGIISLEKGEAVSETLEEYTIKVPILPEGISEDLKKRLENMTWPEGLENWTSKVAMPYVNQDRWSVPRHYICITHSQLHACHHLCFCETRSLFQCSEAFC